jgi:hypothetical protein
MVLEFQPRAHPVTRLIRFRELLQLSVSDGDGFGRPAELGDHCREKVEGGLGQPPAVTVTARAMQTSGVRTSTGTDRDSRFAQTPHGTSIVRSSLMRRPICVVAEPPGGGMVSVMGCTFEIPAAAHQHAKLLAINAPGAARHRRRPGGCEKN